MPTRPFTAQELEDAELAMMLAHLKRRIEVQESRRPRSRRGVRRPQVSMAANLGDPTRSDARARGTAYHTDPGRRLGHHSKAKYSSAMCAGAGAVKF